MKIQLETSVINGVFKRNRNLVLQAIKSFEGKNVLITFDKPRKQRSNNQNSYYWGLLIPIMQNCINESWAEVWSKEKTHDFFKLHFCYKEKVNESTGEVIKVPKSTTENSTTDQEFYHQQIRDFIFEWFEVVVPLPNENLVLEF